ncbi:MAG: 8-amino-3,8-dideoxy-manno-octulosonate cytidylyltransferase [Chlamydiae bacterium]|nr:8-amino-3,8-dideoxy-manno-octulosonate cytidylyltransferase [Chlamydiota bacterium]
MTRVLILIQARLRSQRLPGKALKPILGKAMLSYTFERLQAIQTPHKLVLATSDSPCDRALETLAHSHNISCFRGSEKNVLERFYQASQQFCGEILVRITGDCPLVQPSLLDRMLSDFMKSKGQIDYLSNVHPRSYPKGMDLEIFNSKTLNQTYIHAKDPYELEHVTPYIYRNPHLFSIVNIPYHRDLSTFNVSVDTPEDFQRVSKLIEKYTPSDPLFELDTMEEDFLNYTTH